MKMHLVCAALLAAPVSAQTPPANPPPRCEAPVYRQFDFWVGEWNVFDTAGKQIGQSSVTREEAGCLLIEHWTSAKGNKGQSYNFYDEAQKKWRQVWISPTELTDYFGALNAKGEMVLEGDVQQVGGNGGRSRGTWTANADGSVRQRFEDFDKDKKTWSESFSGIYKRKD